MASSGCQAEYEDCHVADLAVRIGNTRMSFVDLLCASA